MKEFFRIAVAALLLTACLVQCRALCATDTISGLILSWVSATQFQVASGSAYVPAAVTQVDLTSPATVTLSSPTADVFYYVFLTSSATIVTSTTAPGAPYRGVARKDSSGDRYLGAVLINGSQDIVQFTVLPDGLTQYLDLFLTGGGQTPLMEVLYDGTATTLTNVSCSAVVPPTSTEAYVRLAAHATLFGANPAGTALISNSASVLVPPTSGLAIIDSEYLPSGSNPTGKWEQVDLPLDTNQEFNYCFDTTPAWAGLIVQVIGYFEFR
jgi:hypothetical protein